MIIGWYDPVTVQFVKSQADRVGKTHSPFFFYTLQFCTIGFIWNIVRIIRRNNMKFSQTWIYQMSIVSRAIFVRDCCHVRIVISDKADTFYHNKTDERAYARPLNGRPCSWLRISDHNCSRKDANGRISLARTFYCLPTVIILYRGVVACNFVRTINFDLAR